LIQNRKYTWIETSIIIVTLPKKHDLQDILLRR